MNSKSGFVRNICISPKRGTAKKEVPEAVLLVDWGIDNDAHAGHWHRQVSLLPQDKINIFNQKGAGVSPGDFGET